MVRSLTPTGESIGKVTRSRQGNALTQKQPVIEPNDYQKSLEQGLPTSQLTGDQVRYWSDFNRVFYHPRSIVQLNEYELNSQLMPFENWNTGHDLFNDLEKASGLFDRDVRLFAEECDQLAGIQIFTSTDDAWGGFTSSYADVLRDEFGKTSIWLWGLEDAWRVDRVSCASGTYKGTLLKPGSRQNSVVPQTWPDACRLWHRKYLLTFGCPVLLLASPGT